MQDLIYTLTPWEWAKTIAGAIFCAPLVWGFMSATIIIFGG